MHKTLTKKQLIQKINELKKEKEAIILAHYYQNDDIQEIADFVGDSYQLSVLAKNTNAKVIVFCGVHFMAETAKILSPDKKVIIPVKTAGCYMADTISEKELIEYKEEHSNDVIISYVNTTATVKALSDVCVTSANAQKIIMAYKDKKIMYVPDQNLARYTNDKLDLQMNYWHGYCNIHHQLTKEMVVKAKADHPNALLMIHPEAPLEVLKYADFIGSTKGMLDYAGNEHVAEYIVGTEKGILWALKNKYPNKKFYLLDESLVCNSMKLITLENLLDAMEEKGDLFEIISLDENVSKKARNALEKMIELSVN